MFFLQVVECKKGPRVNHTVYTSSGHHQHRMKARCTSKLTDIQRCILSSKMELYSHEREDVVVYFAGIGQEFIQYLRLLLILSVDQGTGLYKEWPQLPS